jgi:hypothetical protein
MNHKQIITRLHIVYLTKLAAPVPLRDIKVGNEVNDSE